MSITLNSKVYNYAGFNVDSVSQYQETAGGIPTSYSDLTNRVTRSKDMVRVKWRFAVPVIATEVGQNVKVGDVLRTSHCHLEIMLPATSTLAERQDVRLRLASLIDNTQYIASVDTQVQATG